MNKKKIVKGSIGYAYNTMNFWITFIVCIIMASVFIALVMHFNVFDLYVMALFFTTPFAGMAIYYFHRMRYLVKKADHYELQEVMFQEIHSTLFRTMYFTIKIRSRNTFVHRNTRAIFNTLVFSERNVGNFNNRKVLVGYNPQNRSVITIKILT